METKKKTKKELLEDLAQSMSQLDWLEYRHIPDLKEQLKQFKLTKEEICEYDLGYYPKRS